MSLRIAHLSDVHFGKEDRGAVERALAAVTEFAPELVVITGDLTLGGRPREFRAAAAWLARIGRPILATPGNHDTPYWNLILRSLRPFSRWRRYIGPSDAAGVDGPGLVARSINSARGAQARPDWSKGAINLEALRRIDWGPPGPVRVFACHHPLIEPSGAPVSGSVRRGRAAVEALAAAKVDLVLSGHVHTPFAAPVGGGYALGAGTLSTRTRGEPASFLRITVEARTFEIEEAAWDGDGFSTARTWSLARTLQPAATSLMAPAG